jgi:hypothetical protein
MHNVAMPLDPEKLWLEFLQFCGERKPDYPLALEFVCKSTEHLDEAIRRTRVESVAAFLQTRLALDAVR